MASDKKSTFAILLAGMLIGGFVVFLLFLSKVDMPIKEQTVKKDPLPSVQKPSDAPAADEENKFDFYDMLPEIEVSIDGEEVTAPPPTSSPTVKNQTQTQQETANASLFYLQVGAFSEYKSANKHKANLLLNNFPTKVQKGTSSAGKTLFRVYVGPYSEGKPLDKAVNQLKVLGLNPYKQRL